MNTLKVVYWTFLLVLIAPLTVTPQTAAGNPENWCRNGAFPEDGPEFKLGTVVGAKGAKVYFYSDDGDCPKPIETCKNKSYLIPGDKVLISRLYRGWLCSWYQSAKGRETVGWLPDESVEVLEPEPDPPLDQWVGDWRYYDQSLEIKKADRAGALHVAGTAFWHGLGDNIHTGEVDATSKPKGPMLILNEYDCQVSLQLVGDFLVVVDNSNCGGANVRFNGVYRKAPQTKPRRTKR